MINHEELTKNKDKIIAKFVVILARRKGWIITEDNALNLDDSDTILWRNTAHSLFEALLKIATPVCASKDNQDWGGGGDFL
jgi:hypothetical protein